MEAWAASTSQYVQESVKNVEPHLDKLNMMLKKGATTPLSPEYPRPELDVSPELDPGDAAYYQSLIVILRWMIEMGRVDMCCEISIMSSCIALPREGHLQQLLYHVFAYLKVYHKARIVFVPSYPDVNFDDYRRKDRAKMYGDAKEEIPPNCLESLGKEFTMRAFVDSDHAAGDLTRRRSRTGCLVCLNIALIYWLSKKQTAIETSSFGSEFIAMKQCCEYIRGLRYKLRMMGMPVTNPTFISGDNQSVLWNTSVPESTLKKKSNSIAYHYVREGAARDEWRTAYIPTGDNPSGFLLMKALHSGQNRKSRKVRFILYDVYPESDDKSVKE